MRRSALYLLLMLAGMSFPLADPVAALAFADDDLLLLTVPGIAAATHLTGSHATRVAGLDPNNITATCLKCHQTQAAAMGASAHYRWRGDAGGVSNLTGDVGKLGGMNDYCIYPDFNWLTKLTNVDGKAVDGGCAACHVGKGKKLDATELANPTLTNIDCLMCHSKKYKRTVSLDGGTAHFVPDVAAMGVSAKQAAADIAKPDRDACLRCHLRSGGGNNNKRGDIEPILTNPPFTHDVHMSADGQKFTCASCHKTTNHRIGGRGVDLREVDNPAQPVSCTMSGCHTATPHTNTANLSRLNKHAQKIACQTCHIPTFAASTPTDMFRDYSNTPQVNAARLYEPWIQFQSNVTPTYGWSNGTSTFYKFGDPVAPQANGRTLMAGPVGGVNDKPSKLMPLKHHLAKQPVDPATKRLLPLKMGILFQTADVNQAILQGAAAVGWSLPSGYQFADTERLQGIYHGVRPRTQALACATCHTAPGVQGPVDFDALGYALKNPDLHTCSSGCHGDRSGEWSASQLFNGVHAQHVTDEKFDCSKCHNFTRL
ncbi:hypothetical protein [Fundidesulfovibrio agrisoli]|uniref:hypothetical protein n=1 Tax=Fundidesulfovibrio agrisoli TaxID=2922717 RepID=UPI001FAB942B|nr:hypothetical protein [Fundidesulfovibrio agrisoli]